MPPSRRYVLRRVGFALAATWAVLTVVFLLLSLTPNQHMEAVLHEAARSTRGDATAAVLQAKQSYLAARGLDRPLWLRYLDWLGNVATFQWGRSWTMDAPVATVVLEHAIKSARYVLPAMVFSSVAGAFVGLYSAASRYSLPDRVTGLLGYVGMGVPNFWLAAMALLVFRGDDMGVVQVFLEDPEVTVTQYLLPAAVLSTILLGNQIHYARAEIHEHLNENFVDVVRAKGASTLRVARHVLRNAALPLFALFFADLLAVLMLHVFVIETVFGIPGLGLLTLQAVQTHDLPLIIGITMVVVIIGVLGTLLQDLLAFVLDPKGSAETE